MSLLDDISADVAQMFADVDLGFARVATTSGAVEITGIFSKDYYAADPGGNVEIASSQPTFRVHVSDASGLVEGNTLTIDSTAYTIVEIQPDPAGYNTTFRLQI